MHESAATRYIPRSSAIHYSTRTWLTRRRVVRAHEVGGVGALPRAVGACRAGLGTVGDGRGAVAEVRARAARRAQAVRAVRAGQRLVVAWHAPRAVDRGRDVVAVAVGTRRARQAHPVGLRRARLRFVRAVHTRGCAGDDGGRAVAVETPRRARAALHVGGRVAGHQVGPRAAIRQRARQTHRHPSARRVCSRSARLPGRQSRRGAHEPGRARTAHAIGRSKARGLLILTDCARRARDLWIGRAQAVVLGVAGATDAVGCASARGDLVLARAACCAHPP